MKRLYMARFSTASQLIKFVYDSKIKKIVSITRDENGDFELWFYSKQIWFESSKHIK